VGNSISIKVNAYLFFQAFKVDVTIVDRLALLHENYSNDEDHEQKSQQKI
jgi:hypothetical protein